MLRFALNDFAIISVSGLDIDAVRSIEGGSILGPAHWLLVPLRSSVGVRV